MIDEIRKRNEAWKKDGYRLVTCPKINTDIDTLLGIIERVDAVAKRYSALTACIEIKAIIEEVDK